MIVQLPTLLSRCWFSLDGTIHCIITTLAISMSNLDGADFTFFTTQLLLLQVYLMITIHDKQNSSSFEYRAPRCFHESVCNYMCAC